MNKKEPDEVDGVPQTFMYSPINTQSQDHIEEGKNAENVEIMNTILEIDNNKMKLVEADDEKLEMVEIENVEREKDDEAYGRTEMVKFDAIDSSDVVEQVFIDRR